MKKQSQRQPLNRKQIVARLVKTESDYLGTTSEDYQRGKVAGKKWAEEKATARHLRELYNNWDSNRETVARDAADMDKIVKSFTGGRGDRFFCVASNCNANREFTLGFFDAACEVWRDVEDDVIEGAAEYYPDADKEAMKA